LAKRLVIGSVIGVSTAPLRLVTPEDHSVVIQTSSQVPRIESETELRSILATLSGVDSVGAEARIAKLATRSIKKSTKMAALDLAMWKPPPCGTRLDSNDDTL